MFSLSKKIHKTHEEHVTHHAVSEDPSPHHGVLPVSLYLKVFFVLLGLIFLNIGISRLPFSSAWILALLLVVSVIQTTLVVLYFMELIHEDKFYSFILVSTFLFIILFAGGSIAELGRRGYFSPLEDIKLLREVDQNGNFAPEGPKISSPAKSE